jgi:hypothetical protein
MMTSSEEALSSSEAEEHYLESFLSVQLPKLGLDYDTYGPYVVGVFHGNEGDALDEEELDGVLELLRASSEEESYSSNNHVWEQLKRDIIEKHEEYTRELQKVQEKQRRQEAHLREQERLRHDIEIAKTTQPPVEKKHEMDEQQKRSLVERFAFYEELPEEEESEADILVSNKHVSHEANATKTTKESRSAQKTKTTTKREEQAATKQQKLLKMKAKEERRKRATKSERS